MSHDYAASARFHVPDLPPSPIDHNALRRFHEVALRRAAASRDPVLRELAGEVRSGRMTVQEMAMSSAYRDTLAKGVERFEERLRATSEEELRELTRQHTLTDLIDSLEARTPEDPPDDPSGLEEAHELERQSRADDRDEEQGESILRPPPSVERGSDSTTPQRQSWQRRWRA